MVREMDFVDEYYADKDLSLLKKLTLVIPTYNRNYYLSRCLWYHAHFPFGQIIVADSSPEEKKVVNRETVAKVREMFGADILYLEYEPETEKYGGDIYRKWGDAVQHVNTEYSVISIDKAFIDPAWATIAIQNLVENPSFVSIYGNWDNITSMKRMLGNERYVISTVPRNVYSDTTNPSKIILEQFKSLPPWRNNLLFAVTKSDIHKILYNHLETYHIEDIRYAELIVGYFGNIYGTVVYVKGINTVRDVIKYTKLPLSKRLNTLESSDSRYPHFKKLSEISPIYFERFITCLNSELSTLGYEQISLNLEDILRYDNQQKIYDNQRHLMKNCIYMFKNVVLYRFYLNYLPQGVQNMIRLFVYRIIRRERNYLLPSYPNMNDSHSLFLHIISETENYHDADRTIL